MPADRRGNINRKANQAIIEVSNPSAAAVEIDAFITDDAARISKAAGVLFLFVRESELVSPLISKQDGSISGRFIKRVMRISIFIGFQFCQRRVTCTNGQYVTEREFNSSPAQVGRQPDLIPHHNSMRARLQDHR